MAETVTGLIQALINLENLGVADLTSPTETVLNSASQANWTVTSGVAINQLNLLWHDRRTLAAGANEDLDLAGSLVNSFGTTATFVKVKLLSVAMTAAGNTATTTISVGGASANQFVNWVADATDKIIVFQGGAMMLFNPSLAGYAVTAGTGDLLNILNNDGSNAVDYDIVIGGTNA